MTKQKKGSLLDQVKTLVETGSGRTKIARELGISESKATRLIRQIKVGLAPPMPKPEYVPAVRRATKKQTVKKNYPETGSLLIIPDAHSKVGVSNDRFTKLGKYIVDEKPDVIVCLGDWFDLPSLAVFDVGKKSFEGKRYKNDLEAGWDALERVKTERDSCKGYNPIMIFIEGNHEHRIQKVVNNDPKMDGTISRDDLRLEEFGWEVYTFLDPCHIMGMTFQHYFVSGLMDRAIGGENIGSAILKKYHSSAAQGHNHLLNFAFAPDVKGRLMMAGSFGCYFSHYEEWASKNAQLAFWRGLTLLRGVKNGEWDEMKLTTLRAINNKY